MTTPFTPHLLTLDAWLPCVVPGGGSPAVIAGAIQETAAEHRAQAQLHRDGRTIFPSEAVALRHDLTAELLEQVAAEVAQLPTPAFSLPPWWVWGPAPFAADTQVSTRPLRGTGAA